LKLHQYRAAPIRRRAPLDRDPLAAATHYNTRRFASASTGRDYRVTPLRKLESRQVALGSPPQSLGEDAHAECQETPRKPRKRLRLTRSHRQKRGRLTRSREKMDSDSAGGSALHPGDASGGGAIHQSSVDAADVDWAKRRDVLE